MLTGDHGTLAAGQHQVDGLHVEHGIVNLAWLQVHLAVVDTHSLEKVVLEQTENLTLAVENKRGAVAIEGIRLGPVVLVVGVVEVDPFLDDLRVVNFFAKVKTTHVWVRAAQVAAVVHTRESLGLDPWRHPRCNKQEVARSLDRQEVPGKLSKTRKLGPRSLRVGEKARQNEGHIGASRVSNNQHLVALLDQFPVRLNRLVDLRRVVFAVVCERVVDIGNSQVLAFLRVYSVPHSHDSHKLGLGHRQQVSTAVDVEKGLFRTLGPHHPGKKTVFCDRLAKVRHTGTSLAAVLVVELVHWEGLEPWVTLAHVRNKVGGDGNGDVFLERLAKLHRVGLERRAHGVELDDGFENHPWHGDQLGEEV